MQPTRDSVQDDALTQLNGHSLRCGNPFCAVERVIKARGKHGRYCSSRCRLDGYVLRRAKVLLDSVGIVEFNQILQRL